MAFFKNLWTFLTETIFLKDERNYRNGLIRWGVRQYKLLFYTARGLDEHDTLVRSAALTFYTLMSIVPIAALVFAVVKGFGLADGLMQNLYSLFPHNREVVDYLITFADKALAAAHDAASAEAMEQVRAVAADNADTIGWLRIDGTNINNVVMFAPDTPGKYLHMDFYGKWSYRGTLYVAENCDVRTADNILIYGHHMKDGSMFGSLISYKDAAFRAAHPIVQFDTLYASHSYEVVAAIETEIPAEGSDAFRYYDCIGTDPEQFAQYCTFIEQNRCYDTGITIQPGDRLLTLSTCAYHTANGRFLVVARQVD